MVPDPDASLRFTEIPKRMFPEGATGMDLSKHMMDRSYTLEHLMSVCYSGEYRNILAELQLAFVAFLVGQVYDGESTSRWDKSRSPAYASPRAVLRQPYTTPQPLSNGSR